VESLCAYVVQFYVVQFFVIYSSNLYFSQSIKVAAAMHFFQILYDELIGFLGIGQLLDTFKTGNYSSLLTFDGILSTISPLMPLLLLIEIGRAAIYKKFKVSDYRIPFLIYVCNRFISRFLSIAAVAFCIGLFEKYGLIKNKFYLVLVNIWVYRLGILSFHLSLSRS